MSELKKLNTANQYQKRSNDADQPRSEKWPRLGLGNYYVSEDASTSALQEEGVLQHTEICQVDEWSLVKFGFHEKTYIIGMKKFTENLPADRDWMTLAINEMRRYAERHMHFQPGDKLNLCVENHHFKSPISNGYIWKENIVAELVKTMQNMVTIDTKIQLQDCIFSAIVVKMPRGKGCSQVIDFEEDTRTKKCILAVQKKDVFCGPRAIILGKLHSNYWKWSGKNIFHFVPRY